MPFPSRSFDWLPLLLALGLLVWLPAPAQEATPVVGYRTPRPSNLPFLIRPETWFSSPEQGMLMLCPAHAHGPKEQATAELIRLVAQHHGPAPATIWVCRANQLNTLREFAPMVDRICINPFLYTAARPPNPGDLPWPGADHPILNRLRDVRTTTPGRQLIACIDVHGEEGRFGKRSPVFEEMQWMSLATIGSGFQGIAWRGKTDDLPYKDRLDLFTGNILHYASELSQAEPVDWVTPVPAAAATQTTGPAADGSPAGVVLLSSLRTSKHLFVALLRPDYMLPRTGELVAPLPLGPLAVRDCSIAVRTPSGTKLSSGKRLDGTPLTLLRDGDRILVPCRFAGGGTMLVFNLKGQP